MELKEKNCFQLKIRWGLSTSGVSSIDRMFFFFFNLIKRRFFLYISCDIICYMKPCLFLFFDVSLGTRRIF